MRVQPFKMCKSLSIGISASAFHLCINPNCGRQTGGVTTGERGHNRPGHRINGSAEKSQ